MSRKSLRPMGSFFRFIFPDIQVETASSRIKTTGTNAKAPMPGKNQYIPSGKGVKCGRCFRRFPSPGGLVCGRVALRRQLRCGTYLRTAHLKRDCKLEARATLPDTSQSNGTTQEKPWIPHVPRFVVPLLSGILGYSSHFAGGFAPRPPN